MVDLKVFKRETERELFNILKYWEKHAPDPVRGGFYGAVSNDGVPNPSAPRSVVVTSRILWTFSMAYRHAGRHRHLALAERAYHYLNQHFRDAQNGGVYWSVSANGAPLETRKLLYGHSFAIFGLSEYYAVSRFEPALDWAIELFQTIDKHGFDPEKGGYLEAFGQNWNEIDDYLLSKKPYNKTQNTHLHLLEAFTNLYRVWPDALLRKRLENMVDMFMTHLIRPKSHQLLLFMDQNWQPSNESVSFGHDIEASWLLWETAEVLKDEKLSERIKGTCLKMADAALLGLGTDGALDYELDPATNHRNTERSWWVLAEQMVGFMNAYQLGGQPHFLEKSWKSWLYIKKYLIDSEKGEWHGTVKADGTIVKGDKIHFWKGPYHSGRACFEIVRRLS